MKMKFGFEDVVLRMRKKSVSVGIVTETAEDYADLSEEEEDEEHLRIQEGQCRVAWLPRGFETLEEENKLLLGDKSLMPGDIVEYVKAPGKKGYCMQVKVKSVVKVLSSERNSETLYILDVDGSKLSPILPFAEGFAVNLGAWVGIIRHVAPRVLVRVICPWDHGKMERRCWLPERTAANFDEVGGPDDDVEEYELESCAFRRGMKLVGPYRQLSSHATWVTPAPPNPPVIAAKKLGKNLKAREVTVVVCDVEMDYVTVSWSHAIVPLAKKPPEKIKGKQLEEMKQLHVYERAAIQIGRLKRYEVCENDRIVTASEWNNLLRQKATAYKEAQSSGDGNNNAATNKASAEEAHQKPKKKETKRLPSSAAKEEGTEDSSGWTTEDKVSEEGGCPEEDDAVSEEASPQKRNKSEDDGEAVSPPRRGTVTASGRRRKHRPRRSVPLDGESGEERGTKKDGESAAALKLKKGDSIIVETVFTETEADIKWQDTEITEGVRSNKLVTIDHLDEHEYFPGDIVWAASGADAAGFGIVKSADHDERTVTVTWFIKRDRTEADPPDPLEAKIIEPTSTEELAVYEIQEHPEFDFRLGTVVMLDKNISPDNIDLQSVGYCEHARACVGQVVSFEDDGRIKIEWGNGEVSPHWPHVLRRIGDYDSDEGELWAGSESSLDEDSDDDWDMKRTKGVDGEDSDGDDSWETASESSEVGGEDGNTDSKSAEDEAEGGSVYQEDPGEPGTILVNVKKLSPHLMVLDYDGTIEDTPSFTFIRKNFLPKVTVLERIRDRIWAEVKKYPCDGDVSGYENFSAVKLAAVLKDCSTIDELMGTRYFRQRSIDWASFPHLRRTIPQTVLERVSSRLPDMARLLSFAAPILAGPSSDPGTDEDKATEEATRKVSLLIDAAKLGSRGRADLVKLIENLVTCKFSAPETSDDKIKIALGSALFLDNDAPGNVDRAGAEAMPESLGGSKSENLRAAMVAFPNEIMCIMNAWLRDRLFKVSVDIVTEFGSNFVLEMEEFYPMSGPYEGDVTFIEELDKIAEELKNEKEEKGPQETGDGVEQMVQEDDKQAEFHIASPQAILERGSFDVQETGSAAHRFAASSSPNLGVEFNRAVMREMKLLKTSMPKGIYVRAFEDRRDLFSAMIEGPTGTPYEGGLFFFDCQLPSGYPVNPPRVEYISFVNDRLNPNLYEEGKVCVSLLGTWDGRGSELWTRESSLLQVLVSIQGLILNKEPYYNEAGYERQRGERLAAENSRKYNEMAVVKVIQSMATLTQRELPAVFAEDIRAFLNKYGWKTVNRFKLLMKEAEEGNKTPQDPPEYPLMPLTRGFLLCMRKALSDYEKGLNHQGIKGEEV